MGLLEFAIMGTLLVLIYIKFRLIEIVMTFKPERQTRLIKWSALELVIMIVVIVLWNYLKTI